MSRTLKSNRLIIRIFNYCSQHASQVLVHSTVLLVVLALLLQNLELLSAPRFLESLRWLLPTSGDNLTDTAGGWDPPTPQVLREYGSDVCNIDRVSVLDISHVKFQADYRFRKPLLVTFPNGARGWTNPQLWSKAEMLKMHGRRIIHYGQSLSIVRMGGNGQHVMSVQDYIRDLMTDASNNNDSITNDRNYMFDRHFYSLTDLQDSLHLPELIQVNNSTDDSIFCLGSSLTGVVFHKHSETWNGVIHGSKRWFLYPNTKTPPGGVHHGYTVLEWLTKVYPSLSDSQKPMECVQRAGEILYLPEGTYHATLNLGHTVAVALQKKTPVTEAEQVAYKASQLESLVQELQEDRESRDRIQAQLKEVYKQWLDLLPGSSEAVMKMGKLLYDMGDYSTSLTWHERAITSDPYFTLAYIHLGKTLSALRQYEKAESAFKEAMAMSPNLWDVYKEYGEFLLKQGRHKDALPIYKKGTELAPEQLPFWFYYRLCQLQLGDQGGAENSQEVIQALRNRRQADSTRVSSP